MFHQPLSLSNRNSKKSKLNLKIGVAPKRKTFFLIFSCYKFHLIWNLNWRFVWGFTVPLKILMQKIKKSINEISICANFSYKCAPNPVGRIDPSRLERFKATTSLTHKFHHVIRPGTISSNPGDSLGVTVRRNRPNVKFSCRKFSAFECMEIQLNCSNDKIAAY